MYLPLIRIRHFARISLALSVQLITCALCCACEKEDSPELAIGEKFSPDGINLSHYILLHPEANLQAALEACEGVNLKGKSIAYIGGSLVALKESNVAKALVYSFLGQPDIYTYARGGHGFSTANGSFKDLVHACRPHDIYILWCSTNDYYMDIPQGEPTHYTEQDGFNPQHSSTQCGGMNYCIRYLKALNPNALIIGFTSLPFFGTNAHRTEGYQENSPRKNKEGLNYFQYIQAQDAVFTQNCIPYLNQWDKNTFTPDNYIPYYAADGVHMSQNGYFIVGCNQLEFLGNLFKKEQTDE